MSTDSRGVSLLHSSGYSLYYPYLHYDWLWLEGRQVFLLPVLYHRKLPLLLDVWCHADFLHSFPNTCKYSCLNHSHMLEHFLWIPHNPTGMHLCEPWHYTTPIFLDAWYQLVPWAANQIPETVSLLQALPVWWRWFYWTDPVAWTIYGVIASQFGDINRTVTVPGNPDKIVKEILRETYGMKHDFIGYVVLAHFGYILLFLFLFAYGTKTFNFQKR